MKTFIKKIIKKDSLLFKLLASMNSLFIRSEKLKELEEYQKRKSSIFFVQIGSNDGKADDPLYKYIKTKNWKGILIEPVPYIFKKLKQTHPENKNLMFENSAIAISNNSMPFYRLKQSDDPNLPQWYDKIGSFNKDVVLKSRNYIPDFDNLLITDWVNAITFEELVKKYDLKQIDILHIDTEGYDFEILKMVPFEKISIDFILFEHKHLSFEDYSSAHNLLVQQGYNLTKYKNDTCAMKFDQPL